MLRLCDEQEVYRLQDSPCKRAMMDQINKTHCNMDGLLFDALADCGGCYYLLEPGDSLTAIPLHDDGIAIDLTDLDNTCYEFIDLSDDGAVFVIFLATNDAGGPCFFIPNDPWIGDDLQRALAATYKNFVEAHHGY